MNLIFSYLSRNTWFWSAHEIEILNSHTDHLSLHYLSNDNKDFTITLPYTAIQEILSIIKENKEIFSIKENEISDMIAKFFRVHGEYVLDSGYDDFFFSDEINKTNFSANDIGLVENTDDVPEKIVLIKSLCNKISDVLIKYTKEHDFFKEIDCNEKLLNHMLKLF